MDKYTNRKYDILPYNPLWKESFETEAQTLRQIFGADAQEIEHIGSTSVSGMAGKPTIDILILVPDLAVAEKHRKQSLTVAFVAFLS